MNDFVLDASVAAKWFLPDEPLGAESMRLLTAFTEGRVRLAVPDLFWPELGNVLWNAGRRGRIVLETAAEAVRAATAFGLSTKPSLPLLSDAFAIATRFQCTVYDATYVGLAASMGRVLITADERLANGLAAYLPVRWLGAEW